ncbi:MAG TPA: cytochrome c [Vicinamibacterales bacterium]|nr:cytochrome c [Vicinamibacterales bacterium]
MARTLAGMLAWLIAAGMVVSPLAGAAQDRTGRDVYEAACAACHGSDGRGVTPAGSDYPLPRPDFTDCRFANREPDADWLAVSHAGGPARGFDRLMPAFGDALSRAELEAALGRVRAFCTRPDWPRGELNLARPLVTEKAFPEDEYVVTLEAADDAVTSTIVYERRIGPRNQLEVVVPVALSEREPGDWTGGVGDLAVAFKRALAHSLRRGSILSASAELVVPTGSTERGIGGGTTVIEPFVTFGQILPADSFLHAQVGVGIPFDRKEPDEVFWRAAAGREFTRGEFGRAWSPMIELLWARDLESGARTNWDIVPEMQVTLSTRQHIMANAGVRIPLTNREGRSTQFIAYLLWDWFDGGFFTGW